MPVVLDLLSEILLDVGLDETAGLDSEKFLSRGVKADQNLSSGCEDGKYKV